MGDRLADQSRGLAGPTLSQVMPLSPEKKRDKHYQQRYGITTADFERMLASQGGVCALCRQPPKQRRLNVDHDHDSGAVRELLCNVCNRAIGLLEDPAWYAAALDYLKRHHPSRYED